MVVPAAILWQSLRVAYLRSVVEPTATAAGNGPVTASNVLARLPAASLCLSQVLAGHACRGVARRTCRTLFCLGRDSRLVREWVVAPIVASPVAPAASLLVVGHGPAWVVGCVSYKSLRHGRRGLPRKMGCISGFLREVKRPSFKSSSKAATIICSLASRSSAWCTIKASRVIGCLGDPHSGRR